jgi:hypothetical protein
MTNVVRGGAGFIGSCLRDSVLDARTRVELALRQAYVRRAFSC